MLRGAGADGLSKAAEPAPVLSIRRLFQYLAEL